uniref:C2H2-type domain-containing protein n=1 Tax=Gadus morhua TaxID=8049 RepID=A0A8C5FAV7_GADMO
MLIKMSPCGPTLEEQLSSIMDVLAKAAVSEISQLFSEGSATLRLQITQSLKENQALRMRMKVMRSTLFSLRIQTRSNASCAASRFTLARDNICKPQTKPQGDEHCDVFGDRSTQCGATSESLYAPGSSHMSSHSEELRILSVHGKGEGPLALVGHDTLFTASKREALNSLPADHSVVKSLERGEQLVHREELTVQQQTPDTILIKDEEVIGGGMPAVEYCDDFGDCSTQHGATLDNLHVDAPGSSHMSSHNRELRILSVYGNGEGPLTGDGHDNPFTAFKPEALSSLPAVHSVGKSLERGEQLVHREELTGQQTPDTILTKDEEDIGGGMPAVEDCDEFGDCSTQHGATLDSLHVEAPGSSHMSSNSEELRILSVHGKGEYPLAVDGHDNLFTVFKLETLSSLSAEHSVAKRLEGGEQLVHREELTGHRGGGKDRPAVLSGECFPDKTNMVIHRRTHTGEKPYGCDQCTERFKLKDSLKSHMRRTHSGEKPYRCDQCVKCYYRSSHLKRHMKTHSGEKPYRCDQCVKRFSRSCILKEHLRTHSGEKPYRCNQCVKRFISSSHLNVHMRTHSGEKPYRCNQCVKRFSQSSALKRHMRTHYG